MDFPFSRQPLAFPNPSLPPITKQKFATLFCWFAEKQAIFDAFPWRKWHAPNVGNGSPWMSILLFYSFMRKTCYAHMSLLYFANLMDPITISNHWCLLFTMLGSAKSTPNRWDAIRCSRRRRRRWLMKNTPTLGYRFSSFFFIFLLFLLVGNTRLIHLSK